MQQSCRRFLRNASVMVASAVLMRTVGITFNAMVSARVGTEGMGLYTLVMSVYNFSVTLATSGVHLAVTRTVSEHLAKGDQKGAQASLFHALLYAFCFGTLTTVILLGLARPLGIFLLRDARTIPSLRMLGVSMLPLSLSTVMNGYFIARKKAVKNAVVQVFEQAVRMGAITLFLWVAFSRDLTYVTGALVLGGVVAEILSFLLLGIEFLWDKRKIKGGYRKKIDIWQAKQICGIALPVAFSAYIRSGLLTLEHALIPLSIQKSGKSKAQALSDYGLLQGMALPIVLYPTAILYAVSGLLIPEFAERKARGQEHEIGILGQKTLYYAAAFSCGAMAQLVTFSRELGLLFYHSYEVGGYVFGLALILPLMFLDHVTDCMLKGVGEQLWTMWVNIGDAICSIFLVILLLPKMGVGGYVLVIMLAEGINFAFSFGRLLKKTTVRPSLFLVCLLPLSSAYLAKCLTCHLLPMDSTSAQGGWTVLRMLFCGAMYVFLYMTGKWVYDERKKRLKALPSTLR